MKFIKTYILLFICLAALFACKKSGDNYTIGDVDIARRDTTVMQATYNVEQYDTLTISPKIDYRGDVANLSYQWLMYIKSPSSLTIGPPTILSTAKNLKKKMDVAPGNYYLELVITDNANGVKSTSRSFLNVLALIESGWLVLHSDNGESDVDFITNSNLIPGVTAKRVTNMITAITGSKMKGNGQFVGYSRRQNSAFNWITVGTDQGIKRFNGFSFAEGLSNQQLFRRPETSFDFIAHLNNSAQEVVVSKTGKLYGQTWTLPQEALFGGVFNGDYAIAPYLVCNDFSPYGVTVYDQKYGKFLYTSQVIANLNLLDYRASIAGQAFNPLNVGKELLFMDRGFNKHAYAFFKDRTGNGRYLYVLNQTNSDAGNLAQAAYNMTNLPDILNARFFDVGSLGNVALYATTNKVYRFDYSGTQLAEMVFDGFPVGEQITSMKIYKPRLNLNNLMSEYSATDNSLLYIATWNGTEGKLYELRMNVASGIVTPTPLNVYTGFRKINDMTPKFRGTGL